MKAGIAHPLQYALALAFLSWTVFSLLVGVFSWWGGGETKAVAAATALMLAPAFAGFILLPDLPRTMQASGLLAAWLVSAIGLMAGTGGLWSPLCAMLLAAPALAYAMGSKHVTYWGAAAALCYPLAGALAPFAPWVDLGPFAQIGAVAAIGFGAGLITITPKPEPNVAREAALAQRVAEVSHDLRTPLTHILGFAEILEKELFGPIGARNVEYAGLIRQSGGHLLELVNDLLDLSKLDAGRYDLEKERFDARDIIDEVVRLSTDAAMRKEITLTAPSLYGALPVNADPRALRRMLTNTVGNALKFTPQGGNVTVIARAERGVLVIDTVDTGPGIPEAERARLGNAYEQGESGRHAQGTGLGLSLVRGLAELHGGRLSFHDAPGGGALVRIELPVLA